MGSVGKYFCALEPKKKVNAIMVRRIRICAVCTLNIQNSIVTLSGGQFKKLSMPQMDADGVRIPTTPTY
jgi:hypothetical protein